MSKVVAIVNDWAGDQHVYGPFPTDNDAIHFCQTHPWGRSFKRDENGQVPFGVSPLLSVKYAQRYDAEVSHE